MEFERQTNRLSISVNDLMQTISFLKELCSSAERADGGYSDVVRKSLLLLAIISYSKPFSRNEVDEMAKADPKVMNEAIEDLSEEERTLHDKIICLRNKAVAHSEWKLNPTTMSNHGVFSGVEFSIWSHLSCREVVMFNALAEKVSNRVHHLRADKARHVRQTVKGGS